LKKRQGIIEPHKRSRGGQDGTTVILKRRRRGMLANVGFGSVLKGQITKKRVAGTKGGGERGNPPKWAGNGSTRIKPTEP